MFVEEAKVLAVSSDPAQRGLVTGAFIYPQVPSLPTCPISAVNPELWLYLWYPGAHKCFPAPQAPSGFQQES